jgi:hypothetical protein
VQGTITAGQQAQAAQAAATQTALVGQNSGTQTAVIQQLGQTQTPQAQTQVALPTMLLQTAQAGSAATQTQAALVQQATQTADAFSLAMTQTIAAFGAQQSQTALAVTQQAGIGATQTALSVGFAQTQTAASLFLTQTALAQPTAAPTATLTPTPIADVVVRFDATPVTAPIPVGTQFIEGEISVCMIGFYQQSGAAPDPPPQQYVETDTRCHLPDSEGLTSYPNYPGQFYLYPLEISPQQTGVNLSRPFLTTRYPGRPEDELMVLLMLQRDTADVRIFLVHTEQTPRSYQIFAYDEQGVRIASAQRDITVPGPYALAVTAQRPIRSVLIGQLNYDDRIVGISRQPVIAQIEVNYTRR